MFTEAGDDAPPPWFSYSGGPQNALLFGMNKNVRKPTVLFLTFI